MKVLLFKISILLTLVLSATQLQSQTITRQASWTQPAESLSIIQAEYIFTFKIDTGNPVQLVATCTAPVPPSVDVKCTAPVIMPTAPGQRTLVLTAINAFGQASVTRTGNPPGTQLGFGILVFYSFP